MNTEWIAITAGIVGGATFLMGMYLAAIRKAAQSCERPFVIFLRCLFFLSLVHGIGLVVVTGIVLLCTPIFFGPIPVADREWMVSFILVGLVFVVSVVIALRFTGWFKTGRSVTS